MAITVTTVLAGTSSHIVDVTATADGDTATPNIIHGLGETPLFLATGMLLVFAATATPGWAFTTVNSTHFILTKNTATGSGNGNPQVRATVMLPHSIIR